jgi:hypothetical protein
MSNANAITQFYRRGKDGFPLACAGCMARTLTRASLDDRAALIQCHSEKLDLGCKGRQPPIGRCRRCRSDFVHTVVGRKRSKCTELMSAIA